MTLTLLSESFTVCKCPNGPQLPDNDFVFTAKTDNELSLLCPTASVPACATAREDNWRGFRIAGSLDFSLVGILARISSVLAERSIPLFAVSTFDTDYFFVSSVMLPSAIDALRQAGYTWEESSCQKQD